MPNASPKVTLIATVLNEEKVLPALLGSIGLQTRQPDEVVFVDGGSQDRTVQLLRDWGSQQPFPVHVLVRPGSNIASGRNLAIEAASHDVVAVTDAGVTLEPRWLEALTAPFASPTPPDLVAGLFQGQAEGVFHTAMCATVLPLPSEIREESFLPSSRSVAFTKSAWRSVGGYPEWTSYCEDLLFDMALLAARRRFILAPEAVVHFPPRRSLPAFWRQYHNYAMGDGQSGLFAKRHLLRYGTYFGAIPALAWATLAISRWWLLAYVIGAAIYLRHPFQRLAKLTGGQPWQQRLTAALWVPIIRVWGDLAKMAGYPLGLARGFMLRGLNETYKAGKLRRPEVSAAERTKIHQGGIH